MRVKLYMSAYFLAHAVYQSYMSLYYKSVGLSSSQIGYVFAAIAAVSIPGQLLFGAASDRASRPERVLRVLLALSAVLLFFQGFVRGFVALFCVAALFGFFYTSVQPLSDAAVLSELNRDEKPFGPVRLMGAIAFAIASLLFGFAIDFGGQERWVVVAASSLMAVACLATFLLKPAHRETRHGHPFELFKDEKLRRLLLFTLPAQVTMGYFYAFFPTRFMELPGASGTMLGVANCIAAVAEIPFLIFSDRLFKKFGAAGIVAFSTLALGVRWLIVGFAGSIWPVLASQVLHGVGYIAISVVMALHISQSVPEDKRASGQALLSVFLYGIARIIGNALGGLAADGLGQAGGFLLCAGLCGLSLAAYFPIWRGSLCK